LDLKYGMVGNGFHSGAITDFDTSLQRPLLMTASVQDQSVRIWNYLTNKCELYKNFTIID